MAFLWYFYYVNRNFPATDGESGAPRRNTGYIKVDRLGSSPITKGLNCPFFLQEPRPAPVKVSKMEERDEENRNHHGKRQ